MLYTRHLRKGDVYVHADINNATPVFVKNSPSTPNAPIPPSTLTQAGSLVVSTSTAWQSKALMSAWWVSASQVSKLSSSGDYLEVGSFETSGRKNYLPPAPLLIGLGTLFQISDSSKARHKKHRIDENVVIDEAETGPDATSDVGDNATTIATDQLNDDQNKDISDSEEDFPDVDLQSRSSHSDSEDNEELPNPLISFMGESSKPQKPSERLSSFGVSGNAQLLEQSEPASEPEGEHNANSAEDLKAVSKEGQPSEKEEAQNRPGQRKHQDGISEGKNQADKNLLAKENLEGNSNYSSDGDHATDLIASNAKDASSLHKQSKSSQLPRGKRSKQKKAATKYAHQDDSDRELALSLLGHNKEEPKKPLTQKSDAAKAVELMQQKQRRREQHQKAQLEGKKKEEERRAKMESNDEDLGDDSTLDYVDLDALVGTPLPGDEIAAALPVCAPWAALSRHKYKVKMQPGLLKKGKAVREILGKWEADYKDKKRVDPTGTDTEKIWPNEIEQMRAWKDTEVIGIVPVSKVRVIAPAGKGTGGQQPSKGKSSRGGRGSKKQR